jgi:hypothetical protein
MGGHPVKYVTRSGAVETRRLSKFSYVQRSREIEKDRFADMVTNHVILGKVLRDANMYTLLLFNADIRS